jgi:hypothetical protein
MFINCRALFPAAKFPQLWLISILTLDVLAAGAIITESTTKTIYCDNFWLYNHQKILANGFSVVCPYVGGNTIFGLFLLVRSLSPLSLSQLFYPNILWFIVSRFLLNLIPGIIAWENLSLFAKF